MTCVVQVDGAPGAGKTHTLRQKLEAEREERGVGLTDFYWLTFTRAGREDVVPELGDVYQGEDPDDVADRARTFHSLALRLCNRAGFINADAEPDPIIVQGKYDDDEFDPYAEFCERNALRYDPDAADPRTLLAGEADTEATGNQLFAINDYLTQTCREPAAWATAPVDVRMPGPAVERNLRAWESYKQDRFGHRLFEHGDYVELAYHGHLWPAVDVLLVDEFQDLAPLEYRLFKLWRDTGRIERAYIAGDPNQSIYSFRGGTPTYFEGTDVDDRINLKTSRRNPERVAAVGNAVLDSHPSTDPRGFDGHEPGGTVRWPSISDKWQLREAVVDAAHRHADATPGALLLTRTNHQLRNLESGLKAVGVPFGVLGSRPGIWRGDLRDIYLCLSNWASGGQAFRYDNLRAVLDALPDGDDRRARLGNRFVATSTLSDRPVLGRDAIADAFEGFEDVLAVAGHLQLEEWKRDVLANALDAPAGLRPRDVQAGTVHTAKGLEAPAVFVFAETTAKMEDRYQRDDALAAEEHRVYYVATTRPSAELHLVTGFFDGPLASPLRMVRNQGVAGAIEA